MNRLGRKWANSGYGDLKVRVGREEITCVKAVFTEENEIFKKLIEDEKFEGTLELCEGCTIDAFLELEKYYSGGCMNLDNCNVCKILSMCIYYNEKRIVSICEEYIKNHLNEDIIIELCDSLHLFKTKELADLSKLYDFYLVENGYKILSHGIYIYIISIIDESLMKLKIEGLEFILQSPKLVIENETWLLNQLLKWYESQMKEINEESINIIYKYY